MIDKKKEFEKIFRDNYSQLFYCALDFVDDADEAKDIVSDACMEAWRHFDQLRSSNPSSYLYMSVSNRQSLVYTRSEWLRWKRLCSLCPNKRSGCSTYAASATIHTRRQP